MICEQTKQLLEFWNKTMSNGQAEPIKEKWVEDETFNQTIKDYIHSESSILDYGCGQGWALFEIANTVKFSSGLGIDPSKNAIDYCNGCNQLSGFDHLQFITGDQNTLLERKQQFDTIVSFNVLDVIMEETLLEVLSAIKSSLKENGVFILGINPDYPMDLLQGIGYQLVDGYLIKEGILRGNEKTLEQWIKLLSKYFNSVEVKFFSLTENEKKYPRRMFICK